MTIPAVGCSRTCAPQPACSPAWNRSRRPKPSRSNIPISLGKNRRDERNVWWSWLAQPSPSLSCRAFCTVAARFRACQ